MFDGSHHILLDALHQGSGELGTNDWVLTRDVLEVTAIVRDPLDVYTWAQLDMGTLVEELLTHGISLLLSQVAVPSHT